MKFFIEIDPQPHSTWTRKYFNRLKGRCPVDDLIQGSFLSRPAPYKIGDEIEYFAPSISCNLGDGMTIVTADNRTKKGTVKSCTPIQRDGRWQWEIGLE